MAMISFFKKPKHLSFKYVPRYWNQEKEDLEQRINTAKKPDDVEAIKSRISSKFRGRDKVKAGYRSTQVRRSNMRLVLIIGILIVLTYIVLGRLGPAIEQLLG